MALTYVLAVVGFAALIRGADWLVDGASALAKRIGVSALVIGLTVVSFGTSAPEMVVSVMASLSGSPEIAIGNVLGSNIANILLILGVAALIRPLLVGRGTVWREIPFSLLAATAVALLVNDALLDGRGFSELSRIDGLVLFLFFAIFMAYVFVISRNGSCGASPDDEGPKVESRSVAASLGLMAVGLTALILGGRWVVGGATELARFFGLSEAVIALTVVAIGTSLPELVTSAVAAYRGSVDIAVGNVVGSNIFNSLLVLGVSAVVRPIPFSSALNADVALEILISFLLFLIMFIGRRHVLERRQGGMFIFLYLAYLTFLVIRERAVFGA